MSPHQEGLAEVGTPSNARGRWPRATSRALLLAPRRCHLQPVPGAGVPTYLPLHALRQAPHPKTPGAARGRRRPQQKGQRARRPLCARPRGPPGGAAARPRQHRRRRYLVLGRRIRLAGRPLPQLGHAWRPRRDVAAGEQRSRRSGQLSGGARGLRSAGPAPPAKLSGPTTARRLAVELCPAQRRRRPFTRTEHSLLQHRPSHPAREEGPRSERARAPPPGRPQRSTNGANASGRRSSGGGEEWNGEACIGLAARGGGKRHVFPKETSQWELRPDSGRLALAS